jgi:uncharacterized protein YndB with AHSA1/START domain
MAKLTAKTHITIHAAPDKVWLALTTPAMIKQFMFGADVHTDWKIGSPLTYTGEYQGKNYEEKGTIKQIEPGKLLAATHFSSMSGKPDVPENYALVMYQLEATGATTVLTVTQDNIDDDKGVEGSVKNWTGVLQTIKKIVEGS